MPADGQIMSDSLDYLRKLEEKIGKAADAFKRTQAEKRALEEELEKVRASSKDRGRQWEAQERELQTLRREREEIRGRVEKLLEQIEALTKAGDSAG
jgi:FtsZ-binding cell division protein ZapB